MAVMCSVIFLYSLWLKTGGICLDFLFLEANPSLDVKHPAISQKS